jgi:hypothetical protein
MTRPGHVRINIGRLIVHGAPEVRGELLFDAMAAELVRLASTGAPPAYPPGELAIDLVRDPLAGGRAIAAIVHARLIAEVARG